MPNPPTLQLRLFKRVAAFRRNLGYQPDFEEILARARNLAAQTASTGSPAERREALTSRGVDSLTEWAEEAAQSVARAVHKTYDSSKRRKRSSTTRAERQRRNEAIVETYRSSVEPSIRRVATKFDVSSRVVTLALHSAGIQPKRNQIINQLPPAAAMAIRILEYSTSTTGVSVINRFSLDEKISDLYDENCRNMSSTVALINNSQLNIRVLVRNNEIIFARNATFNEHKILAAADNIVNVNQRLRIHRRRFVYGGPRKPEERDGLGYVTSFLFHLRGYAPSAFVVEQLWFLSFDFEDRERVRLLLRRALDSEGHFEALRESAKKENQRLAAQIEWALRVTKKTCAAPTLAEAVVIWTKQSDLRRRLTISEIAAVDHLAQQTWDEFTETRDYVYHLLRNVEMSRLQVPPYMEDDIYSVYWEIYTELDTNSSEELTAEQIRQDLDGEIQDELGPRPFDERDDAQT
jgi:hypothetical protein